MVRCNEIRRQLMDLPMDMLVDILLRLPVESLRHIRRVCKTLLNTIDSLSFIRQHTLLLIAGNNHVVHRVPQLMCLAQTHPPSDGEEITIFATLQSLRYDGGTALTKGEFTYSTSSPSPANYMINFVFYNLFCMDWEDGHCLLINPLLKQVLTLPTDNIRQLTKYGLNCEVYFWYGMGFDDITNTYKIVRVSRFANKENYRDIRGRLVHILVLGTNSWREIPSLPPSGLPRLYAVCAHGDMHWLIRRMTGGVIKGHIISFDFKTEEFHWTPTPPTLQRSNMNSTSHLLTLRGSMAIVETFPLAEGGMKVEIWVMKNYAKKEWAREYSINVDMRPEHELNYGTCGEWEHGIFFNDHYIFCLKSENMTRLFLDLRSDSVNTAICPLENELLVNIKSYTGSLISLKDFGTSGFSSTDEPSS
ncbi:PREDICTED: F-box protein CPR30-like [Fragaria vesca subsp. vesca]|uniref:F-box protein CPR30-like n=1 Tax=Fragaria vesca subsp. vesca TaxID=101020 RepID=UPI0002C30FCC|nr:PREDICTED: F-box protein CPR30-like [Fragaria vesca subsp. vesca]